MPIPTPTRPGNDRSRPAVKPSSVPVRTPRTAPTARINLPFNTQPGRLQYTQEKQQKIQHYGQLQNQQERQRRQLFQRQGISSKADICHPECTNYTSQPVRYKRPHANSTMPLVLGAERLHSQNPLGGFQSGLTHRDISSDMMEAMFLRDPGHFLGLNDGMRYYLWRRTILKLQGKNILTSRLFSRMPIFAFDFRTTIRDPNFRNGMPYVVNDTVRRGTYSYFYSCWRRGLFPSVQDDQQNNRGQHENRCRNSHNPNHDQSFANFLIQNRFWDGFDRRVYENSDEGLRRRTAVLRNLEVHFDIAYQRLKIGEIKDRDDAIAYIEASAEFWSDPDWHLPEGYIPTPPHQRQLQHMAEIYPYAIAMDEEVRKREFRINVLAPSPPKDNRPVWQIIIDRAAAAASAKRRAGFYRKPKREEVLFMEELADFDYEAESEADKKDVEVAVNEERSTTPSDPVVMELDMEFVM